MSKAPAFQFYVRDWLSDPELKMASHSTKGIWIDILCFMWESSERGKLTGTKDQLKRMLGATQGDFDRFLEEAVTLKFGDVTACNKNVTLINRRMYAEYKDKQNTRLRVKRHREKQKCNSEVTVSSSSSSSTSNNKDIVERNAQRPPYSEIITYLNEKAHTHFKPTSKETKRLIKARWNDGFDLEAFQYVIDVKCKQWGSDPKMLPYLRPLTLFGTKFESYLNEVMP